MDRNHTCKLLFEKLHGLYTTRLLYMYCNGINGPGNMLHKRIIHVASHGNKNQHKANR